MVSGEKRGENWIQQIFHSCHPKAKYKIAHYQKLGGMMLLVCVRDIHVDSVRNVAAQTVGTGDFNLGNKGGVAIRLDYHRTSICFVCSHLAAHVEETKRRNQDYKEICSRLKFTNLDPENPMKINDHDMVYWMGDLNYRYT